MKIIVTGKEDGCAEAKLVDGEGTEVACEGVMPGQSIEFTIPGANSAEDVEVGAVESAVEETPAEAEAPANGEGDPPADPPQDAA